MSLRSSTPSSSRQEKKEQHFPPNGGSWRGQTHSSMRSSSVLALVVAARGCSALSLSPEEPRQTQRGGCLRHGQRPIPAAFLTACLLHTYSQRRSELHDGLVDSRLPAHKYRRRTAPQDSTTRMSLDKLRQILRGGGPFRREGNDAKFSAYRSRPRFGVDVSSNAAVALSALSVVLVSCTLPLRWGAPAGLWQSFWLTRIVLLRALSLVYLSLIHISEPTRPY